MAYKEVSTLDADTTVALGGTNRKTNKANPTKVEGYYLGSRTVEGKKGPSTIHFLQTPKGNLGVWGKTDLDRKLGQVAPGTMIRASFVGMTPTPKGDMYKFKVEIDKDNTIEAPEAQGDTTQLNAADDEEDTGGYEASSDDESEEEDEEAAQNAALAALERKKKVEALLKGKSKS